ncbi:hypothetical protein AFL01nite_15990 [Aeromicrobium flavum]|uniref:Uncharacterized protein n=1 Tax=Aeromicrobium flavum TaxID=416568 RepID=A0A512HUY1_9ACTN|nr:hypothetical protein AFL01nite_15990 [Aeromicrobium flavum]
MDVWVAGLLASAVAGAVCALGFLLFLDETGAHVLVAWLGFGLWFGLGAGLALGIVPAGVAAGAWPDLVRSVGEACAVRRLTGVVAAIVLAELAVATIGSSADPLAATPWVFLAVAVCTGIAWLHLQGARRIARRRLHAAVNRGEAA